MQADNATILLVEDRPADVMLIRRAFTKARIANPIQVVDNGEDAIAYLSGMGDFSNRDTHPLPALLLLDLKLPRKSGLEVLQWLRAQPEIGRLPVVVLTSSKETSDVNRAYELGANSYLLKPVTFESLLDMMKTLHVYWIILSELPRLE
jgi:CheY-like chemotaxis protein